MTQWHKVRLLWRTYVLLIYFGGILPALKPEGFDKNWKSLQLTAPPPSLLQYGFDRKILPIPIKEEYEGNSMWFWLLWQIKQQYGTQSGLGSWEGAPRQCLEFRPWDCLERGWEPISLQTVTFSMHSANKDLRGSRSPPPPSCLSPPVFIHGRTLLMSIYILGGEVALTKMLSYLFFKLFKFSHGARTHQNNKCHDKRAAKA